jgi:hypothetical protein
MHVSLWPWTSFVARQQNVRSWGKTGRFRRDLAVLPGKPDQLEATAKEFRRAALVGSYVGVNVTQHSPQGGVRCASASAFAAVPVGTRNAATSRSNSSDK